MQPDNDVTYGFTEFTACWARFEAFKDKEPISYETYKTPYNIPPPPISANNPTVHTIHKKGPNYTCIHLKTTSLISYSAEIIYESHNN